MEHRSSPHLAIIYVLLLVVILWLAFTHFTGESDNEETENWVCSNVICSRALTPQELEAQFCFTVPAEGGGTLEVCRIIVDGVEQVVPRDQINITAQCAEYTCTQEVLARTVEYVLNTTAAPANAS